jgi:hypothetical protein
MSVSPHTPENSTVVLLAESLQSQEKSHLLPTSSFQTYVAKFEMVFFTLNKSTDLELENVISYTAFEEQWETNYSLKVGTPLLRKWHLNVLVHLLESSSLSAPIQHRSHPLKSWPYPSL